MHGWLSVYVLVFQIVMLGTRQTIFSTPYFQFEKKFYLYVMNMHEDQMYVGVSTDNKYVLFV